MVPYYTVYEGKTLDLEPQKKEERLPYRVKNTSSDVNRSSLRIRDGAVLDRTVAMTKTIEYERGDRSAYTAREEKNVNVEQTERIDEAKRKKYIDYIVQYERIRTVLSTKEEYYVSPERISNIKAQMEADSKLQSLFNQSQTLKRACMSHSGSISRDFENVDRLNKKIEEIEKYAKERGYNYYEGYRDGIYYDEQSRRFRWH